MFFLQLSVIVAHVFYLHTRTHLSHGLLRFCWCKVFCDEFLQLFLLKHTTRCWRRRRVGYLTWKKVNKACWLRWNNLLLICSNSVSKFRFYSRSILQLLRHVLTGALWRLQWLVSWFLICELLVGYTCFSPYRLFCPFRASGLCGSRTQLNICCDVIEGWCYSAIIFQTSGLAKTLPSFVKEYTSPY